MKASEMTNEELAKNIDYTADCLPKYGGFECANELREAAARLRNVTVSTDNSAVIVELQRRIEKQKEINKELVDENDALRAKLKVAENALDASLNYSNSDELRKAQRKAKNALAAIREKGGAQ